MTRAHGICAWRPHIAVASSILGLPSAQVALGLQWLPFIKTAIVREDLLRAL